MAPAEALQRACRDAISSWHARDGAKEETMGRFAQGVVAATIALVAIFATWPTLQRLFLAADTPREITPRGDLTLGERSTIELFRRLSPSVVHVSVEPRDRRFRQRGEDNGEGQATGTGFVWDGAGHIVTNDHVVGAGGQIRIRLAGGEVLPATVVGRAPNQDLAVLRLGRAATLPPPIPVGTSADLQVGQFVLAIGNPFGLDQTLTTGVVSALRRRLPTDQGREISDVIQTDAAINPGNSGGPLIDSAGRLIGVNTAIYSPSGASAGIGFAVPVDTVNRIVPQLIRNGRVPTAAIGVRIADEAQAARLGVEGLIVLQPIPGSPAQTAGLRGVDMRTGELGDVILAAGERPVRRLADLSAALEEVGVGRNVRLTILRDGRRMNVEVGVADMGPGR
jgi:2-alkenal reductase